MLRLVIFAAFLQCSISQQYNKVPPGVPPQNYQQQNYQQPPPPPPPQQQQYQPPPAQQQFQQQPPQQQQQFQQQPPQQQFQQVPQQQQFQQQQQPHGHVDPQLLSPSNIAQERDHIQEHMEVPIDTSKMSEQELQFHYFKMHDADNNNKLDGCELIKSLIHWHEEHASEAPNLRSSHYELVIDDIFSIADVDDDGTISWAEFVLQQGRLLVPKERYV